MFKRCMFLSLLAMLFGTVAVCRYIGHHIPNKLYLLHSFGSQMLAYWLLVWINIGTLAYLLLRHFRMLETGRKLKHLDPMRSPDGLFVEEVRPRHES